MEISVQTKDHNYRVILDRGILSSASKIIGRNGHVFIISDDGVPVKWRTMLHEQYRPFVLFHKVQATALTRLQEDKPEAAVEVIGSGLQSLAAIFAQHGAEEHFDEDLFVIKLREMQESIKSQFHIGPSLAEQLADAVATEQYELAAKLRDRLARKVERN